MKNKTVLISGASRGIGRAAALLFAKNGYNVIGTYLNSGEKANELIKEALSFSAEIKMYKCDVSDKDDINRLYSSLKAQNIKTDILINNAGISQQKLFTDITDDDWQNMINTNLSSVFYMCRAFLPDMISEKCGKIINISSIWGEVGGSCEVHYSAAKAGVIGLTKALSKEVGLSGICVNAVAPGATETDMLSCFSENEISDIAQESSLNKIVTPEAVASLLLYLASDEASYITGEVFNVNAGRSS